ncbi:hypothetical protein GCM10009000_097830 [Halobacterium noricense]
MTTSRLPSDIVAVRSYEDLTQRIVEHLESRLENGSAFTKSRHIADALDASVKRVGTVMAALQTAETRLEIRQWGGQSDGATWYITVDADSEQTDTNSQ